MRSVWNFLARGCFALKTPIQGLDFLGFPRILSSQSRLINGLHGIFAEKIFEALLPLGALEAAERQASGEAGESAKMFIAQA
jgi:hypothetical protein